MGKTINLLFWQNCVSPHQLPYIKELYKDKRVNKVYLIAPLWELAERKMMGWENNLDIVGIDIIIDPNNRKVVSLFFENQGNSIHLFSGIRADKSVFQWFKKSLVYSVKRGIITESPFVYKKPLFFHKIRFLLFDYKYLSKINFVFAMGDEAKEYYKLWSKKWNVFLFGYCVHTKQVSQNIISDRCKIVYVGSLIKLKNVELLIHALNQLDKSFKYHLDIIGNGEEQEKLKSLVKAKGLSLQISFLGGKKMKEIHNVLSSYDALVLPSVYDGWGAVVNEALSYGLYVVCSDACGSKTLIESSSRGFVFECCNIDSLVMALKYLINQKEDIRSARLDRVEWSKKINGTKMAKYMVDCLIKNETLLPPWKN